MESPRKIISSKNSNIIMRVVHGHFVTANSHINYYIDLTTMKTRQSESNAVAEAISNQYVNNTVVDTILCMDGCEVIGSYLAEHLTRNGIMSINAHKTLYIVSPEITMQGQMIFRENMKPMISGKHVLILLASTTTGHTLAGTVDTVKYYGGEVAGVSAIFSAVDSVYGIPVHHLFGSSDLPDYESYPHNGCKLCEAKRAIDAICNSYGYSPV